MKNKIECYAISKILNGLKALLLGYSPEYALPLIYKGVCELEALTNGKQ